jgi:hypothetical protein
MDGTSWFLEPPTKSYFFSRDARPFVTAEPFAKNHKHHFTSQVQGSSASKEVKVHGRKKC